MVLLLFFVDFESEGVVVIEEDAEEVVKVDLLVPLGDLEDVVGHDQVRHGDAKQYAIWSVFWSICN